MIRKSIPNILTLGNLFCGVLSIFLVINGYIVIAALLIFIGAILDFLDGFVARLLNAKSEIGGQLDSLSDLVTFGVAPAIIMYHICYLITMEPQSFYLSDLMVTEEILDSSGFTNHFHTYFTAKIYFEGESFSWPDFQTDHWMIIVVCTLFPLFSAYRLAKFNTMPQSRDFKGLPTPAAGLFLASVPLIIFNDVFRDFNRFSWIDIKTMLGFIVVIGVMMVLPFRMFSLKFKTFTWKDNRLRFLFLGSVVLCLILAILLNNIWLTIPFSVITYILLSLIAYRGSKA